MKFLAGLLFYAVSAGAAANPATYEGPDRL